MDIFAMTSVNIFAHDARSTLTLTSFKSKANSYNDSAVDFIFQDSVSVQSCKPCKATKQLLEVEGLLFRISASSAVSSRSALLVLEMP